MKQAVIFGAGNVGRGFIGQLYSQSGYEVTFVDVDEPLIAALQENGSYTIQLVDNENAEQVIVSPVHALNSARQKDAAALALARASLAATAVGARILPMIAPVVAAGIKTARRNRHARTAQPDHLRKPERRCRGYLPRMVEEHLSAADRAVCPGQYRFCRYRHWAHGAPSHARDARARPQTDPGRTLSRAAR